MKYRVLKDNFLWKKDAILKKASFADGYSGYKAVDDLLTLPNTGDEYISSRIVENSPEWFEPIEDTVWEAFLEKVEQAKNDLARKMRAEWRKK